MPKDKSTTSNAAPMTHVVEHRPSVRYQLQVEAQEAAAEAPKASTPAKRKEA